MLILTQNKESLINMYRVRYIDIEKSSLIAYMGGMDIVTLGTYESNDEAKTILTHIIDEYENFNENHVFVMP